MIDLLVEIWTLFLEMAPYMIFGLFFVGVLHLFFTKALVLKHIGDNSLLSVFKAAIFGIPLPLCSCGVIPTAVYMKKNGAASSATTSFLISTPQTGIDSIIATYGMMGWVFAIFRPIAALIMGLTGGMLVAAFGKRKPQKQSPDLQKANEDLTGMFSIIGQEPVNQAQQETCSDGSCGCESNEEKAPEGNKLYKMFKYAFVEFLDDISIQFVAGVIISGLIAYFIPDNFFEQGTLNSGILGMLLMIVVGIPMYICATASIPIAVTLMLKGFSPGVAFVFLAVGPATNAASLTILMNTLGKKIVSIYLGSVIVLSILMGYILDYIFSFMDFSPQLMLMDHQHELLSYEIKLVAGLSFGLLLLASIYRKYFRKSKKEIVMDTTQEFNIEGMSCNHCSNNVESAVKALPGVTGVMVNLTEKKALVAGDISKHKIIEAIEKVGYKVVD